MTIYEHQNLHFDILLEVGWIVRKSSHLIPVYVMFKEICYKSRKRLHQYG